MTEELKICNKCGFPFDQVNTHWNCGITTNNEPNKSIKYVDLERMPDGSWKILDEDK